MYDIQNVLPFKKSGILSIGKVLPKKKKKNQCYSSKFHIKKLMIFATKNISLQQWFPKKKRKIKGQCFFNYLAHFAQKSLSKHNSKDSAAYCS